MRTYSSQDIKRIYDKHARWYEFKRFFGELTLKKLRKELISNAKGKILEVSFGSGANLPYYNEGCKIVGIDLSKEMLQKANEKAIRHGKKITLKEGDVERLPFKNNEFDYVIDTLGLCTFSNPMNALHEMKRVCKKEGKLLLLERGCGDNKMINKILQWKEKRHYNRLACHLTRDILQIVKDSALVIEEEKRRFMGTFYYIIAHRQ